MIAIVNQVYPEFAGSVVLVDIDVNDKTNAALVEKVGLKLIPTLVFYYPGGRYRTFVGVQKAGVVRDLLSFISGSK